MATDRTPAPPPAGTTHRLRWVNTHPSGRGPTVLRDDLVVVEGTDRGQLIVRFADGYGVTSIAPGAILTLDALDPVVCSCGPAYQPLNAWGECAHCHRKPYELLDGGGR